MVAYDNPSHGKSRLVRSLSRQHLKSLVMTCLSSFTRLEEHALSLYGCFLLHKACTNYVPEPSIIGTASSFQPCLLLSVCQTTKLVQGQSHRRGTPPSQSAHPQPRQANGFDSGGRKVSYAEDDGDEASGSEADEDARRAAVAHKNAAVAALLEPDEMTGMDDEVERVLGHRCVLRMM